MTYFSTVTSEELLKVQEEVNNKIKENEIIVRQLIDEKLELEQVRCLIEREIYLRENPHEREKKKEQGDLFK